MWTKYLLHDSLLVVIAQRATELVVVHGWTVLLHAPQPGDLRRHNKSLVQTKESPWDNNLFVSPTLCRTTVTHAENRWSTTYKARRSSISGAWHCLTTQHKSAYISERCGELLQRSGFYLRQEEEREKTVEQENKGNASAREGEEERSVPTAGEIVSLKRKRKKHEM